LKSPDSGARIGGTLNAGIEMEMLRKLADYFPTSVFTGKCLVFVSEEWRVELTEHKSHDFSSKAAKLSMVRVRIFRKEMGEYMMTHSEDFQLPQMGELAEAIEKYVQYAIGRNIREII
jgi:hypothetical protein